MEINNQQPNKDEIIALILADMRNRKLIMGLDAIGLSTDEFNTDLFTLIFLKLSLPKENEIRIYNWYEDSMHTLLNTDLNKFREHQLFLANTLYNRLLEKKKQSAKVLPSKPKWSLVTIFLWASNKRFDN